MLIPQISGEWRTLLKPRRYGKYVNDHTLFYDDAGKRWCLAGITSKKGNPNDERYFVFADTPSLDCKMRERAKIIDNGTRAWAPCVIKENGLYYMFYGPSPAKLEVSHDLGDWFGQEIRLSGNPPMACHRDHFVLRRGDNDFIMYVSGLGGRQKRGLLPCVKRPFELGFRGLCAHLRRGQRAQSELGRV